MTGTTIITQEPLFTIRRFCTDPHFLMNGTHMVDIDWTAWSTFHCNSNVMFSEVLQISLSHCTEDLCNSMTLYEMLHGPTTTTEEAMSGKIQDIAISFTQRIIKMSLFGLFSFCVLCYVT